MFDNILEQPAVAVITRDIGAGTLPSSILFAGPEACGKSSAALELARVLSCKNSGAWNCGCSACVLHRNLSHPDLLMLGPHNFQGELAATAQAFLRDSTAITKSLFFRSVQKLLARFSPAIREGDSKLAKFNPLLESINDALSELPQFDAEAEVAKPDKLEKLIGGIQTNCAKLEAEAALDTISIALIRGASQWLQLSSPEKTKLLLIENAENMNDSARNSLLKILEEPPQKTVIVLTSALEKTLTATLLSRLRLYSFKKRSVACEADIVRRIFRDKMAADRLSADYKDKGESVNLVAVYLESFSPVSTERLRELVARFAASAHSAATVSAADSKRNSAAEVCAPLLKETSNFENRILFKKFLSFLLDYLPESTPANERGSAWLETAELWRAAVNNAQNAVEVYNRNPAAVLEELCFALRWE